MTYTLKMDLTQSELRLLIESLQRFGSHSADQLEYLEEMIDPSPDEWTVTVKLDWSDEAVRSMAEALIRRVLVAMTRMEIAEGDYVDFRRRSVWTDALADAATAWGLLGHVASYRRMAAEALLSQVRHGS